VTLRRIGLVVHPVRDVDGPRDALLAWAAAHGAEVVALGDPAVGHGDLRVGDARDCDLVVAIGGDGTVLGGVRRAALASPTLPVLGVACGSLGMLAGTRGSEVHDALDRVAVGAWTSRPLAGLRVADEEGDHAVGLNDVAVVRKGGGQVKVEVLVDGERYVRAAGDGVVVSTALGSSAYGMAAGGPIVAAGTGVLVVTPLNMHGGCAPSLVVGADTPLRLQLEHGFSGGRVEVDGQPSPIAGERLDLRLEPAYATLITFPGSEPYLTGLRRRAIVLDSPRITAHDARMAGTQPQPERGPRAAATENGPA
jgi:NAD+ kinase